MQDPSQAVVELSCFTDDAFITRCRVSVTDFVAPESAACNVV